MGLTQAFPFQLNDGLHARFARGRLNLITDVPGVRVAHVNVRGRLDEPGRALRTGVTVIIPGEGHPFRSKFAAGAHVINGFGKSIGLMQIAELGALETPIALTNTLAVGAGFEGVARYMLDITPEIGETAGTVNPVVLECNDSLISDLRAMAVTADDVRRAILLAENAGETFEEGAVGAGSGMVCYGLKGGIGSASRMVEAAGGRYTLGCLAMTNFGSMGDLVVAGRALGGAMRGALENGGGLDKGSVIIVVATDAPLSGRQLARVARRAQSGIARTGGYTGHGSGEIALAFSTSDRIPHDSTEPRAVRIMPEAGLDPFFAAMVCAVEESILSSMEHADAAPARRGGYIMGIGGAFRAINL
ncbi:MAG: P1 family peptidase [Oscillospiraceae bacterium]|jgi:D-aminopeptidase|nr:P1 family peptidase [Oscillospiraceae bacterium]